MMYHYDPKVIALVAKDDRDIEVMEARLDDTERKKRNRGRAKGATGGTAVIEARRRPGHAQSGRRQSGPSPPKPSPGQDAAG